MVKCRFFQLKARCRLCFLLKGTLTSRRWHDDRGCGGDHCGHCNGTGSGTGAGAGCQHHCLLLSGCSQNGGGAQFGHCGVVLRFGKDVGHKVGAGRGCHNDHLEEDVTLKPGWSGNYVQWEGSKWTYLLCGGAGGLDGGFSEGDLNGGQMWRQRVGDALHDVAHLGTAADRDCDVLGHLWGHFGDLL